MNERSRTGKRLTAALMLALGVLLAVPALSGAATTFGSRFKNEPNTANCSERPSCSLFSYIEPVDPNGDPYAGGAPVGGVITSFQLYARAETATPVTFIVGNVELAGSDDSAFGRITTTGPTTTIPATGEDAQTFTIPARVPVAAGQHVGISFSGELEATYNSSGDKFTYLYAPRLETDRRLSDEATGELTMRATIEPDADGDGFGDETQDKCPTQAATQGACVAKDVTPPGISGFTASASGAKYTLSEAANVSLRLEWLRPGRKAGARCVAPTKANRKKAACRRVTVFGPLAAPGTPNVPISASFASLGLKKLKPGSYRLTITAADVFGNAVNQTTTFKVKKPQPKKKKRPVR